MVFSDSIIFVTRPEDSYFPPVAPYLGCLTDELEENGKGCFISEFVSAGERFTVRILPSIFFKFLCFFGPKNYAYKIKDPQSGRIVKTVVKCKGFRLSHSTAAHINFKRMKRQIRKFVKHGTSDPVTIYEQRIKRTKDYKIVTEIQSKIHRVGYNKRQIRNSYETYPFGY